MEKYLVKVHELEDELAQAHDEISQLARQLIDCKKNVDRLKSLPSAREKQNTPSQWSVNNIWYKYLMLGVTFIKHTNK